MHLARWPHGTGWARGRRSIASSGARLGSPRDGGAQVHALVAWCDFATGGASRSSFWAGGERSPRSATQVSGQESRPILSGDTSTKTGSAFERRSVEAWSSVSV